MVVLRNFQNRHSTDREQPRSLCSPPPSTRGPFPLLFSQTSHPGAASVRPGSDRPRLAVPRAAPRTAPARARVERRPHPRRAGSSGPPALIRCGGDCGAAAPAPRRARVVQPQSVRSRDAAASPAAAAAGAPTPEGPPSAREESRGEPAEPAPCRPLPIPPRWTVCGATGKVRVFSLFLVHARGAREPREPDSAIVQHFTCGTYACVMPRSFLLGE